MKQITCPLTFIPIRKEASHKAEQVSQLLFGETAEVLEETEEWLRILTNFDNYVGWVERKSIINQQYSTSNNDIVAGFSRLVKIDGNSMWLSTGSEIYSDNLDKQTSTIVTINPELNEKSIIDIALQFLGTPYLWGGRSFMGIDCSGFVQVVFKCIGINLARDASKQIHTGKTIESISDVITGDLAYFNDENGTISHVGIFLDKDKIIHASGVVRIDAIDEKGIYYVSNKQYTHQLNKIKRVHTI